MGTPELASRQAQLWVCRFLLLSPVFTAPLPLLLLSSNFLNCKCRGKCNPILKQVPSKLERPKFLSELTCGKYLSIFHIWIYASSPLLRVWIVAQKLSKRVRLCFANWTIFFMQLTGSCCFWQWYLANWWPVCVNPSFLAATRGPSRIFWILSQFRGETRCARIVHFTREAWVDVIFHILPVTLNATDTDTHSMSWLFQRLCAAPDREGRWVVVWLTAT